VVTNVEEEVNMAISNQAKQTLIDNITASDPKYSKPFREGMLALFNVFGGNWNEYATVVLDVAIADTLLSIDRKLDLLINEREAVPPPIPPSMK
jgi:hypothetical protein